jgi:hypothetical protein
MDLSARRDGTGTLPHSGMHGLAPARLTPLLIPLNISFEDKRELSGL